MSDAINQMQMLYNPEEDRILFRVNSTEKKEFRFWITRRFTFLLRKVLRDHLDADPDVSMQDSLDAKMAVKKFKQENALVDADFERKFNEEPDELPMGDEIPVAFKLTYEIRDENLHMSIQPKTGQGMNMVLNRKINSSLMELLMSSIRKANWAIDDSIEMEIPKADQRLIN